MKICVPRTLGWIDNRGRQENKGECSLGQLARQQPKALPEVPPCPVVTACSLQFSEAVQSGLVTSSPGWRDRNSLGRVTAPIWVHFDLKKKKGIRKDISLKELFSFVKRIRNPGFSAWQTKTGTLRSTGEGIAMPCRFECFPKGECSSEEPENSCRSKGSLAQRTSRVQNLLCHVFWETNQRTIVEKLNYCFMWKTKK